MDLNRARAERAIGDAERELRNGLRSLEERDHTGALKYLQECSEYAAKAVLIAYGIDYPKVYGVGRHLKEYRARFPGWFETKADSIGEFVDALARNRPMFRYHYEYPKGEHKALAEEMRSRVNEIFKDCKRLTDELFP